MNSQGNEIPDSGGSSKVGPQHVVSVPSPATGIPVDVRVYNPSSEKFAARLRKRTRDTRKWARKNDVACFRVYDSDLPDYPLSIDYFEGSGPSHGAAYAVLCAADLPDGEDRRAYATRLADAVALSATVMGIPREHMFVHQTLLGTGQDDAGSAEREPLLAFTSEAGHLLELDLSDPCNIGLRLQRRMTRALVGQLATGKKFLNLFAYAGAATLYAAGAGAQTTMTVDMHKPHIDWARRNMKANGFVGKAHRYVCADIMEWVVRARSFDFLYDLAFIDPLAEGVAKSRDTGTWDVQRDHVRLLTDVCALMVPGSTIVFSCGAQDFVLDEPALRQAGMAVRDVTAQTVPFDFVNSPHSHQCFLVDVPA